MNGKLTDDRLAVLMFLNEQKDLLEDSEGVLASDLSAMVAELRFYRTQIASQNADELADLAARSGLTGKLEMMARALATTTARYGTVVHEKQTVAVPTPVYFVMERGYKAIRDADELALARVIKNLEALPHPEDIERYKQSQKEPKP